RLRGAVEGLDQRLVDEGVHLHRDVAVAVLLVTGNLAIDAVDDAGAEAVWGDEQLAVVVLLRVARERVEEVGAVRADRRVAGEEREVRVDTGRHGVVVAGAEVDIAPDAVSFAPDDEADLGMSLETENAVDDVHAFIFKRSRPRDVVLFVEAG